MGRGFLAGIFWGGIVGLALLFVAGLTLDRQELSLPRPEAVPVEVPAGTEFDQARPESEPVVPEVETRPAADGVAGVVPPEDAVEAPPAFDTTALEVPQPVTGSPGALGEVPGVAQDVDVDVAGPGPSEAPAVAASPVLPTPEAPTAAPETATEAPAVTTAPEVEAAETPVMPAPAEASPEVTRAPAVMDEAPDPTPAPPAEEEAAEAPAEPAAPEPAAAPETEEAPNAIVRVDGGESEFFRPVEEIGNLAPDVETGRLPRIGEAPEAEETALPGVIRLPGGDTPEPALDLASDDEALPDDAPALLKWRMPFDNPGGQPLMSIVLVNDGAGPVAPGVLAQLPDTVSFAVPAGAPGAKETAAAYRAAGREVVMIPSIPEGAAPQDVEVALRVNFATVPEAVAVMDNSGDSFQTDRDAVAQVVDVVARTGHGLITFPRGLNTAHQRAERAGVPTGLIFRDIDGEGQDGEQIRRALDRAAFRARQDEAVILVGRATDETLAALTEWVLGNRAASVTLAPVSAALIRR